MRLIRPICVVAVLLVGGCGGGGKEPTSNTPDGGYNPSTPSSPSTPTATSTVNVEDNRFDPSNVAVAVGTTVTWNFGGAYSQHNVTFDDGPTSPNYTTTGTYQRTFTAAGTYKYKCSIHGAAMSGQVVVQ